MEQMKMTPQELEIFRNDIDQNTGRRRVDDETLAKAYASKNESFRSKWENPIKDIYDEQGNPMEWNTVALNMEVYGNPYGPSTAQSQPQQQGSGLLNAVGNFGKKAWDYATAPIDLASGLMTKGIVEGADALGFDEFADKQRKGNELLTGLESNARQTADILPAVGAAVGSVAGPAGTGAGAFAGKAVGNLIDTVTDMATGKEQETSIAQKVYQPVVEGGIAMAGDKLLGIAGKHVAVPLAKKGASMLKNTLIKGGAMAANLSDDVLERAFNQPKLMTSAIHSVKQNVKQPFVGLSQKIGNGIIQKLDDAGKELGLIRESYKNADEFMKFDVSASVDDFGKILKEENLLLVDAPPSDTGLLELARSLGTKKKIFPANPSMAQIKQGKFKPIDKDKIKILEQYIKDVTKKGKNSSLADVEDLTKLYTEYYQKIGFNADGTTSQAQRLLRRLRTVVDDKIDEALPADLAAARKAYSQAKDMAQDYSNIFVTEHKGKYILSDKGESWLNVIHGRLKEQRRLDTKDLSDFLGVDIVEEAQILKDASQLLSAFPQTGSRQKDIVASLIINNLSKFTATAGAGAAYAGAGLLPAAAGLTGLAATSPRVIGKAVRMTGAANQGVKSALNSRAAKGILGLMKKLAPAEKAALYQFLSNEVDERTSNPDTQASQ